MKKDTVSLIEGAVCICSGIAFADVVRNTFKNIPHGKGLVKSVGRLGLYAGTFVMGAEVTAQAIKLGEGIFEVTKKHVNIVKEEFTKETEAEDEVTERDMNEVVETPSDESDISENGYEE